MKAERSFETLDLHFDKVVDISTLMEALDPFEGFIGISTGDFGEYRTVVHCALDTDEAEIAAIQAAVEAHDPGAIRTPPGSGGLPNEPVGERTLDELIDSLGDETLKQILREILKLARGETVAPLPIDSDPIESM